MSPADEARRLLEDWLMESGTHDWKTRIRPVAFEALMTRLIPVFAHRGRLVEALRGLLAQYDADVHAIFMTHEQDAVALATLAEDAP